MARKFTKEEIEYIKASKNPLRHLAWQFGVSRKEMRAILAKKKGEVKSERLQASA